MNSLFSLTRTDDYVHVRSREPRPVLNSAVLNGGLVRARHLLNLQVDGSTCGGDIAYAPPEETLASLSRAMG